MYLLQLNGRRYSWASVIATMFVVAANFMSFWHFPTFWSTTAFYLLGPVVIIAINWMGVKASSGWAYCYQADDGCSILDG